MRTGDLVGDRFELVRRAGRGGMGEVWVARDSVLGREVAVKVLDLGATQDPTAAERFQREARATAALGHPHVVTVYDHGTDGPVAFLVMELLAGPDIGALVRQQGALPLDRALEIAEQAAAALTASHAAGVVHRDVKPGNLVLDARGRVKVLDFGIARLEETSGRDLTGTAMVIGSAAYMSPEQASGQPASAASDLYALGCVLTTLLTGEPPFTAEHPVALLREHIDSPPPDLRERRSDVPSGVAGLVAELLRKEPGRRPRSAEVVRERLSALRAGSATGADAGTGGTAVLAAPVAAGPSSGAGAARAGAWLRTRPRSAYVAAGVIVLGLLLVVVAALAGGSAPTAPEPSAGAGASASRGADGSADAAALTASGYAGLREALERVGSTGAAGGAGLAGLRRGVEEVGAALDAGDPAYPERVAQLAASVDGLARGGELTAAGAATMRAGIDGLPAGTGVADDPAGDPAEDPEGDDTRDEDGADRSGEPGQVKPDDTTKKGKAKKGRAKKQKAKKKP